MTFNVDWIEKYYKSLPENDHVSRQPDISLAKKTLKWVPKISLNKGLLETIKYFQKNI